MAPEAALVPETTTDRESTTRRTLSKRGVLWLGQTCNLRCYFCYFLNRIADNLRQAYGGTRMCRARRDRLVADVDHCGLILFVYMGKHTWAFARSDCPKFRLYRHVTSGGRK